MTAMTSWDRKLLEVLLALKDRRREEARARLEALSRTAAPHAFDSLLVRSLDRLSRDSIDPYVNDAGFRAFIRGGGNVPLYRQLSARLAERLKARAPAALLDIGAGDGLVYEPLPASLFSRVDLVEPSPMLASSERLLREKKIPVRGHAMTIEEFLAGGTEGPWDAALASFSLQCLPSSRRSGVFSKLRHPGFRLFVAEFDTPAAATSGSADERFAYMCGRYRRGLEEYPDTGELVAEGFLVPIFLSAFWQEHVSFEQSLADWRAELTATGFSVVEAYPLHRYWWADAFLLEAAA